MRFSNELGTRDYVTKRILDNCEKNSNSPIDQYEAFLIINQKCVDNYGPNVYYYINLELLKKIIILKNLQIHLIFHMIN